ncbi:hypothetical protein [Pseudomonas vancouverensis]|uniref:Uncharacterized protein n=1 Tax=Pseudomonas vancouverensis TaxID=95300 RepID=A0A1H2M7A7_PSEVA|nr:hypothetical protein [Pseudomonas vancouverensis]KAB0498875.1 hypothetical protein F7R09_06075 [Pseudomonas vancouverensis]TDB57572.1 hypothetical protein EIY72_25245 [Pseudomonas vancouverensis]SDU88992.1 hypothetical protein SAMN05216558_0331 [Pseudomonas vancouverensis]
MAIHQILLTANDFDKNGYPDAVVIEFRHNVEDEPNYSTIAVDHDEDGRTVLRLRADLNEDGNSDIDEQAALISLADNFLTIYRLQKDGRA